MLKVIIFLGGAVLMALEMVGSRLLAPTFGSSIYVWGSLIVVVMTALTTGYYYGGRLADRHPSYLVMGIILAVSGLYIGFLPFWFQGVNDSFGLMEPRLGSLLASLSFFFLPSVLLATISPYGIKLTSHSLKTIGNTAGFMAAISSAGSIIGTLLTSFFLIPALGVRNIVHILGAILLLLSVTLLLASWRRSRAGSGKEPESSPRLAQFLICLVLLCAIVMVCLWTVLPNRSNLHGDARVLYDRDTLYHHITVDQVDQIRHLHFDESYQSAMDVKDPLEMVFLYTSYLHLGVVARPQPSRALFVGLGGGSAPKKFLHDYPSLQAIDAVDIDPEVARVAQRYFKMPADPRLRIVVQDGRLFVEKKAREIAAGKVAPYDIVVIDAYTASTIPYHLTTLEFFDSVRRVLSRDGVMVSNIIGAFAGSSSPLLRSMTRTIGTVFPRVYHFPVGGWGGAGDNSENNVIVVATVNAADRTPNGWKRQAEALHRSGAVTENVQLFAADLVHDPLIRRKAWLNDVPLLTDDYAPVDTLQNPL